MVRAGALAAVAALVTGCGQFEDQGMRVESPSGSGGYQGSEGVRAGYLPAGTRLVVQLDDTLDRDANPGQRFRAHVARDLRGPNGEVVVPEGSQVLGHVADVRMGGGDQPSAISLAFDELRIRDRSFPLDAQVIGTDVRAPNHGIRPEYVLGGAIGGAILGGILGQGRGALAGAALGAGAGTLISLGLEDDGELPEGTALGLELRNGLALGPQPPSGGGYNQPPPPGDDDPRGDRPPPPRGEPYYQPGPYDTTAPRPYRENPYYQGNEDLYDDDDDDEYEE